jgi:hypothetical protein
MAKSVGIWASGLQASATLGILVGSAFTNSDGGFLGMVGAPLAFACARLWLTETRATL